MDAHELLLLKNGNYLVAGFDQYRANMKQFGRSKKAKVEGLELQEIRPNGKLVWRWNSRDHIKPGETDHRWLKPICAPSCPPTHFNSAEVAGNGLILSFRHLNAVYK